MSLVDFLESTASALVATHHPYHWLALGWKVSWKWWLAHCCALGALLWRTK